MMSLSKAADATIILMCLVLLGILAMQEWQRPNREHGQDRQVDRIVGQRIVLATTKHEVGVVLHLSTDCTYCVKSVPFYRRIAAASERSRGRLVIAAHFTGVKPGKEFLAANDLADVTDLGPVPAGLSTGLVPTLLLTDANGRIVKAWVGYLDESQQALVLSEIRARCEPCITGTIPGNPM